MVRYIYIITDKIEILICFIKFSFNELNSTNIKINMLIDPAATIRSLWPRSSIKLRENISTQVAIHGAIAILY